MNTVEGCYRHTADMAPTLYITMANPPVRSVLLCAEALGLDLNLKKVDLLKKEHLQPEFIKLNPQHTVPVLDDDGFILADSHAILTYLVSKYGKNDSLYPKDLKKRAIIDHRLHFDSSTFFVKGLPIAKGVVYDGEKAPNPKYLAELEDVYSITETFLENNKFIAGEHLTVADFTFVATLTTWNVFFPFNETKFPKIAAWLEKMKSLPYYQEGNQKGLDIFTNLYEQKLIENNQ